MTLLAIPQYDSEQIPDRGRHAIVGFQDLYCPLSMALLEPWRIRYDSCQRPSLAWIPFGESETREVINRPMIPR